MDPLIYEELIAQEDSHWWFLSRRAISQSILKRLHLPSKAIILDAGCGSGGNLSMLAQWGEVYAFELNDHVRQHASVRHTGHVAFGNLPETVPFAPVSFDLITMFDVLEHVEQDKETLRVLSSRLKPGGVVFLTVPAYPWLFTRHDRLHHHFRRYTARGLIGIAESAGLQVEFISFWNCLLLPAAIIIRLLDRFGYPKQYTLGTRKPGKLVNRLFTALVSTERFLMPYIRLPCGLSIILVARKPAG